MTRLSLRLRKQRFRAMLLDDLVNAMSLWEADDLLRFGTYDLTAEQAADVIDALADSLYRAGVRASVPEPKED